MTALVLKNKTNTVVDGGSYSSVTIIGGSNNTVRNLKILPPPAADINSQAVRVVGSPGTVIESCEILGAAATTGVKQSDPGPAGLVIGLWAGEGIHIERSPNSIINKNTISRFHQGISFSGDSIIITENRIFDLRTSGIVGVPGANCLIANNYIGDSHPWRWGQTPAGDHGDKIHLWTTGKPCVGLSILGNTLDDAGGTAILGIFLQPKAGGFDQATIEHNTIKIGQSLAMFLGGVRGSVSYNTLIPLSLWKRASIYSTFGNAGVWRSNTGGRGVVFNAKLNADQRDLVTVIK